MMGCKARCCKHNPLLHYEGTLAPSKKKWNDFKRCSKTVHEDGFCEICFNEQKSDKRTGTAKPDKRWKRDGIYGEPYAFPYHTTKSDKAWVEMIYTLHPQIRPIPEEPFTEEPVRKEEVPVSVLEEVSSEEKIAKVLIWLDNNAEKINYKLGSELKELLS